MSGIINRSGEGEGGVKTAVGREQGVLDAAKFTRTAGTNIGKAAVSPEALMALQPKLDANGNPTEGLSEFAGGGLEFNGDPALLQSGAQGGGGEENQNLPPEVNYGVDKVSQIVAKSKARLEQMNRTAAEKGKSKAGDTPTTTNEKFRYPADTDTGRADEEKTRNKDKVYPEYKDGDYLKKLKANLGLKLRKVSTLITTATGYGMENKPMDQGMQGTEGKPEGMQDKGMSADELRAKHPDWSDEQIQTSLKKGSEGMSPGMAPMASEIVSKLKVVGARVRRALKKVSSVEEDVRFKKVKYPIEPDTGRAYDNKDVHDRQKSQDSNDLNKNLEKMWSLDKGIKTARDLSMKVDLPGKDDMGGGDMKAPVLDNGPAKPEDQNAIRKPDEDKKQEGELEKAIDELKKADEDFKKEISQLEDAIEEMGGKVKKDDKGKIDGDKPGSSGEPEKTGKEEPGAKPFGDDAVSKEKALAAGGKGMEHRAIFGPGDGNTREPDPEKEKNAGNVEQMKADKEFNFDPNAPITEELARWNESGKGMDAGGEPGADDQGMATGEGEPAAGDQGMGDQGAGLDQGMGMDDKPMEGLDNMGTDEGSLDKLEKAVSGLNPDSLIKVLDAIKELAKDLGGESTPELAEVDDQDVASITAGLRNFASKSEDNMGGSVAIIKVAKKEEKKEDPKKDDPKKDDPKKEASKEEDPKKNDGKKDGDDKGKKEGKDKNGKCDHSKHDKGMCPDKEAMLTATFTRAATKLDSSWEVKDGEGNTILAAKANQIYGGETFKKWAHLSSEGYGKLLCEHIREHGPVHVAGIIGTEATMTRVARGLEIEAKDKKKKAKDKGKGGSKGTSKGPALQKKITDEKSYYSKAFGDEGYAAKLTKNKGGRKSTASLEMHKAAEKEVTAANARAKQIEAENDILKKALAKSEKEKDEAKEKEKKAEESKKEKDVEAQLRIRANKAIALTNEMVRKGMLAGTKKEAMIDKMMLMDDGSFEMTAGMVNDVELVSNDTSLNAYGNKVERKDGLSSGLNIEASDHKSDMKSQLNNIWSLPKGLNTEHNNN